MKNIFLFKDTFCIETSEPGYRVLSEFENKVDDENKKICFWQSRKKLVGSISGGTFKIRKRSLFAHQPFAEGNISSSTDKTSIKITIKYKNGEYLFLIFSILTLPTLFIALEDPRLESIWLFLPLVLFTYSFNLLLSWLSMRSLKNSIKKIFNQ